MKVKLLLKDTSIMITFTSKGSVHSNTLSAVISTWRNGPKCCGAGFMPESLNEVCDAAADLKQLYCSIK